MVRKWKYFDKHSGEDYYPHPNMNSLFGPTPTGRIHMFTFTLVSLSRDKVFLGNRTLEFSDFFYEKKCEKGDVFPFSPKIWCTFVIKIDHFGPKWRFLQFFRSRRLEFSGFFWKVGKMVEKSDTFAFFGEKLENSSFYHFFGKNGVISGYSGRILKMTMFGVFLPFSAFCWPFSVFFRWKCWNIYVSYFYSKIRTN